MFKTRLSCEFLETRDNPSGGFDVPPVDPIDPPKGDPASTPPAPPPGPTPPTTPGGGWST